MSKNKSHPKKPGLRPEERRFARTDDLDTSDIFVDEPVQVSATEDEEVKLTDISDIVAKYAVVDKVFDDEDEDEEERYDAGGYDDQDYAPQSYEAEAEEEVAEDFSEPAPQVAREREPLIAYDGYGAPETVLPERPKIVFRRPRMLRDELHSNWSDNAGQAVDDIKTSHLREVSSETDEPEYASPQAPVLKQHRSKLFKSVGISVGLPVVGGALFALVLYMQKDAGSTDIWSWMSSDKVETAETNTTTPTPNFAEHPAIRQSTTENTTTAAVVPAPASPESGVNRTAPPTQQKTAETDTDMATPPASSPNPVYMARLTVSDTEGTSLTPIPLSLAVAPGVPEQRLRIRVSGLPEGAQLSNGSDLGNGEWLLREQDLEHLTMALAPGFSGQITLLAEVIDDATHIQAAPSQKVAVNVSPEKMVVQPAAATPDNPPHSFAEQPDPAPTLETAEATPEGPTQIVPQNSPFSELQVQVPTPGIAPEPESKVAALTPAVQNDAPQVEETLAPAPAVTSITNDGGLIAKGDELMNNGDIFAARLFYERALKKGDARAATALGKSYDPVIYQQLKVHGVIPDPNIAIEWYRKGAEGGDTTATARLQALSDWLKQ